MGVKLTERQLEVVKSMTEFAEVFADQVYTIMQNHGLDKVQGCTLNINVDPSKHFTTKMIDVGDFCKSDFGHVSIAKGKNDEKYSLTNTNSAEYELLFADEALRGRMEKIVHGSKPLPPDGLWIGDPRNDSPVGDRWEWDVNDSLS